MKEPLPPWQRLFSFAPRKLGHCGVDQILCDASIRSGAKPTSGGLILRRNRFLRGRVIVISASSHITHAAAPNGDAELTSGEWRRLCRKRKIYFTQIGSTSL